MVAKRGAALLQDPRLNRSTAFSAEEREAHGLTGLLPAGVDSLELQLERARLQLASKTSDIERYIFLNQLHDHVETVFYALLMGDPAYFLPLIYTPTVGEACQRFGHIIRRPRGMFISARDRGRIRKVLANWPVDDVRFIVVTNGERVLGLGDLGANGMGIPIGKLALYTAVGGVPPETTLPVMLDCGCNNRELLADPLYLGLRQPRIPVHELDDLVEEFMAAVAEVFPRCCVQFEDWGGSEAVRYLGRYRERALCFNDDIQGTAATALAGVLGALTLSGGKLIRQRFLFLGAGSAGTGIADMLTSALRRAGLGEDAARRSCWLFDKAGLVVAGRDDLADFQRPFAHQHPPLARFIDAVEALKPTAIFGVSAAAGAFDEAVLEAMARLNRRPIIFPFSNPTSRAECTAQAAYRATEGRAIFASGSPFPPVHLGGQVFVPGQGNNVYIFPGLAMAVYATGARRVTEAMLLAAAHAVAEQLTQAELKVGLVYPPQSRLPETELYVATRVAEAIYAEGLASVRRPRDIMGHIHRLAYRPAYRPLAGVGT